MDIPFEGRATPSIDRITYVNFVECLLAAVPETACVIEDEDPYFEGDLLLHPLMSALRRFATQSFHGQHRDVLDRLLAFVDSALTSGNYAVNNAVCVSFIEHAGDDTRETSEFIGQWPKSMLEERDRQLNWRPR
ncbi:hypothetical protein [Conyzicola sp.]|uniref:DUF7674 family protein n=1 Tax=Conyzicola sp. TaxID=1969404 RepID=UPI003989CF09